jgi:sugar phosphate isomerase/epimerase
VQKDNAVKGVQTMNLGFVSAIFADQSFEEVFDFASENDFSCVEVMCWPKGKAERRYAGITHIDVGELDKENIDYIKNYVKQKGVEIASLGYYPNPLDPDRGKGEFYVEHIKKVIKAANKLGLEYAEECNVKIGIENCPMIFTYDEWPGGNNLASTPTIWRRMFEEIPSENFGLNYDPSHFVWMQMDYIKPIYEFRDKMFHVHIKDVKILKDKLDEVGIFATPLEFHSPKLPGLGDVNWSKFISALTDIGYKGAVCIEVEDRAFEDSLEDKKRSLILSKRYMNQFVI